MRTFEEYIKEKEPTLLHNLKQFDLWKFIDKLNTDYITEIEQVKKLNIDDVSERILLVRWMDGNPILDGADYFINMDEALERYNEIPKFKNVEYTICKIRNAR